MWNRVVYHGGDDYLNDDNANGGTYDASNE